MSSHKVRVYHHDTLIKEWTGIGEVKPLIGPLFILVMMPVIGDDAKGFQVMGPGYSAEILPDIA